MSILPNATHLGRNPQKNVQDLTSVYQSVFKKYDILNDYVITIL